MTERQASDHFERVLKRSVIKLNLRDTMAMDL